MYRLGLSRKRIAELVRAEPATVGYHLVIARRQDPGLEAAHQAAAGAAPVPHPSPEDLARMEEIIAWISAEGRFPRDRSEDKGERSMARWLSDRRREAADGTLHPAYREGLARIPGWAGNPRAAADEAGGMTGSPSSWTSAPKATTGPATTTTPQAGNTCAQCILFGSTAREHSADHQVLSKLNRSGFAFDCSADVRTHCWRVPHRHQAAWQRWTRKAGCAQSDST